MQDYSSSEKKLVIFITALVSGIGFIDTTALNVALPFIQRDLNASAADTYWVIEIYLLGLAALLMAGGALGDSLGRRRPLIWGVALFAITSAGCALSTTAAALIFFRALQGISAALMVPASLALLNASFAPDERGPAIGRWSALVSLTIPIGPLFGGLAVDLASWQLVFWVNVPLCLLVLYLMRPLRKPPYEPPQTVPLDVTGSGLVTASLAMMTYALMEAGRHGSITAFHAQLLCGGIFTFMLFIYSQMKLKAPMIPPFLLTNRRFVLVNIHTFCLFASFQSATFFLSFLLVQSYGYGATQAGAAALPISILVTLLSRYAGQWTSKHGPKTILIISSLLMAASFFWLSGTNGDYFSTILWPMILLGLGVAAFAAPVTTVAMASAGKGRDGLASGVNNAVARIGPLLAIAALGYVMAFEFETQLTTHAGFADLSGEVQQFMKANLDALGGMIVPADWPADWQDKAHIVIADSYANTVTYALKLCAWLLVFCAFLCLFYRKEDAV
ncbi:MAG: MFS transporter [Candidatus Puniceispirillaceae bacterium]